MKSFTAILLLEIKNFKSLIPIFGWSWRLYVFMNISHVTVGMCIDARPVLHVDLGHLQLDWLLENFTHVNFGHFHLLTQVNVRNSMEIYNCPLGHLHALGKRGCFWSGVQALVVERFGILSFLNFRLDWFINNNFLGLLRCSSQSISYQ